MHIQLKLFDKSGKQVLSTNSASKARILHRIRTTSAKVGYLKISYGAKHYNDGTFSAPREIREALDQFTEKALVEYLNSAG